MKILVVTSTTRRIGGVETYLSDILPVLSALGHELAVICENAATNGGETILVEAPAGLTVINRGLRPRQALVAEAREIRPDIVYSHGLLDPALEREIHRIAPTVFFVHNYHGTCIAGSKRWAFPTLRPCTKKFGPGCLAYYYPRRCGGLNPITMWRMYREQRQRLRTLHECDAIVTHSFHMYSEYARYKIDPSRLHRFVYYSPGQSFEDDLGGGEVRPTRLPLLQAIDLLPHPLAPDLVRLTFTGRIDLNKGVHLLLDAAPIVARLLNKRVDVAIVGDGPSRSRLMGQADRVRRESNDQVRFQFPGWLPRTKVAECLDRTDIVVVPSAWPEPFGLVGPEAGNRGIPVVAYDVGGVRSWMVDGVNGYLAAADPPTARGLAEAIRMCLRDQQTYDRLRIGGFEMAKRFSRGNHVRELITIFEQVLSSRRGEGSRDKIPHVAGATT